MGRVATMGPTTARCVERLAGNLLRSARARNGLTQRQLAVAAGVPQSTVARIESGVRQPSMPVLARILVAVGLEPRISLEPYDDHDDVLDALDEMLTEEQLAAKRVVQDQLIASIRKRPG